RKGPRVMPAITPTLHPRRHNLSSAARPRNEHKTDQRLATAAHPPDGERGAAERRTSRPGPSQQRYALVPGGDALRRARLPVFTVQRLGVVMAPEPGNPLEVEGVLNPAGAVGPDGQYYLFPRLVAAGNYSRIGVARVRRDGDDRPSGVERLGVALEPQMPYELVRPGVGGCEDPRITYLPCAGVYVMAYTALGPRGPHVALASSRDLRTWRRHGLVDFAPERGTDFNLYTNKDALLLPEPVVSPSGALALA